MLKIVVNYQKNHSFEEKDGNTFLEFQIKFVRNNLKRVLGVEWDTRNDEFVFHFSNLVDLTRSLETTKRNVLKISASFYDPLGLISPVTARVKTIFQLLCKDKLDWDEKVPLEIEVIWESFLSNLENWNCLKVKRFAFYEIEENILSVDLHRFCDRSNQIYCAVVYLRIETMFGIRVSLLVSKTKVTPLKKLSMPRLELLSCVLLSKLLNEVLSIVTKRICVNNICCWSDSEVALCWIKGKEKSWRPWVENRVVNIRKVADRDRWFHVEGVHNPADIPTRVVSCEESLRKWLDGPEILYKENVMSVEFDAGKRLKLVDEMVKSELKGKGFSRLCDAKPVRQDELYANILIELNNNATVKNSNTNIGNVINLSRYSSFEKLINVTCFVFRFMKNFLYKMKKQNQCFKEESVSIEEREEAINRWIIHEQDCLRQQPNFQ